MNRFWESVINPVLQFKQAKTIVEIGSQAGLNTLKLLEFCKENDGVLHTIDPLPSPKLSEFKANYANHFIYHENLSLSALPLLKDYDAILIDGDHNWYTVYNELKIIDSTFKNQDKMYPIIFLHDICWPYGRRDLYYNPENIPLAYRQAYKKAGIIPGNSNLTNLDGINSHLDNSIYENNPQNGVLTAVEDFMSASERPLHLFKLPFYHGLGILMQKTDPIFGEVKSFLTDQRLINELFETLESNRIQQIINLNQHEQYERILKQENKQLNDTLVDNQEILENKLIQINNLELELTKERKKIEEIVGEKHQLEALKSNYETQLYNIKRNLEKVSRGKIELMDYLEKTKNEFEIKKREIDASNKELYGRLKQAEFAAGVHLNSVRYRLGDVIISGLRPSKNTLLMPIRIAKLFWHGLRKRKSVSNPNKNIEEPINPSNKIKNKNVVKTDVNKRKKMQEIIQAHENLLVNLPVKCPLVSILIVNRNGSGHLERLFTAIYKNSEYPNYEVIIVDNSSTDNSLDVIERYSQKLPIKVVSNSHNATFSEANNQAAKIANGEYLLLLNNDIEPLKGWLSEMVKCMQEDDTVGTVGSKLIYPIQPQNSINKGYEVTIQHMGIAFEKENDFIRPYNLGKGLEPDHPSSMFEAERAAVTAAALLVKKDLYFSLGGLDEGYIYGYEDVDFGLKVLSSGYKNIYCPKSVMFHHEFGTQQKDKRGAIRDRRLNNINLFKKKWYMWLKRHMFLDKINGNSVITGTPLKVALIVSEKGENVSAGDYFTALELGQSLLKLGWEVSYVPRKGGGDWYDINEDIDVLISLLDVYDPKKVNCTNPHLIKVAWMRNWFDRWVEQPNFHMYDIILCSSKIACEHIKSRTNRDVFLLPIATNESRFMQGIEKPSLKCDYCFTGSYWNDAREIIDHLNPDLIPYKFHIYGMNWDKLEKFKPYHQGFLNYDEIPNLYKSTKIVIDDANRVTKPYGSVNSRVFDAISAGALVLTNGYLGAQETFQGELPVYNNAQELQELLTFYLSNDDERLAKVKKLQEIVFSNHTYDIRAEQLKDIILKNESRYKISIKIAAPKWETVNEWGDYHMALGLKKHFEFLGHKVLIQLLYEWDNGEDENYDVVIVLRGLNAYRPKEHHINIMWNISHPDKLSIDELNQYDYVFVSSTYWHEELANKVEVPVESLLQCTDPDLFKVPNEMNHASQLLFVGNSRKIFRKVIKDLLPTKYDLSVYGTLWESIIDKKYIKGTHIPNPELFKYYGSCDILLNDHWDDMRDKGFISNRIFDALATKAFIITDNVKGIEEEFGDAVVTYETSDELKAKIQYYLDNPQERVERAEKGSEIVLQKHTYKQRVEKFVQIINQLMNN